MQVILIFTFPNAYDEMLDAREQKKSNYAKFILQFTISKLFNEIPFMQNFISFISAPDQVLELISFHDDALKSSNGFTTYQKIIYSPMSMICIIASQYFHSQSVA